MRTSTRTSALLAAVASLAIVAGCGADKHTSAMCVAWNRYAPTAAGLETETINPVVMLSNARNGLRPLHQMRAVADETDIDAVDDTTAALNSLIGALHQHPADVESERLDFLDAHQTLADLVVDECSN